MKAKEASIRSGVDRRAVRGKRIDVAAECAPCGRSPLRISGEKGGWKTVKVMRVNSAPWEGHVFLKPGAIVALNATLKSKFGTLSLEVFSDDVQVIIDGKTAGTGSMVDFMIAGGMHDIGARNSDGSESVTETVYIPPGGTVRWQARFGQPSKKAFFISMVVPGLGQVIGGSPGKGFLIMGGFAAACLFTYTMSTHYQSEVSQYNDALDRYKRATSEDGAVIAGNNLPSQYQRLNSPYKLRTAGFALAGAIYIFSLVDAFLNHSTVNTMSETALGTSDRTGPDVAVSPSGGRMTLRISF